MMDGQNKNKQQQMQSCKNERDDENALTEKGVQGCTV